MKDKQTCPCRAFMENPTLILFLGASPAVAMTAGVTAALGIGAATLIVMLLSNALLCALRRAIPARARIPATLIVVAFLVSAVQMTMNALLPTVYQALGVYLAATAANLLVFHDAEQSVNGRGFGASMRSALAGGLIFAALLFCLAAVREILGSGAFAGIAVPFFKTYNIPLLAQAPGGLLAFGVLAAILQKFCPRACGLTGSGAAFAAAGTETSEAKEGNAQ